MAKRKQRPSRSNRDLLASVIIGEDGITYKDDGIPTLTKKTLRNNYVIEDPAFAYPERPPGVKDFARIPADMDSGDVNDHLNPNNLRGKELRRLLKMMGRKYTHNEWWGITNDYGQYPSTKGRYPAR